MSSEITERDIDSAVSRAGDGGWVMKDSVPNDADLRHASRVQMRFGKHKGKSLGWIAAYDPEYLRWLSNKKLELPCLRKAVPLVGGQMDRKPIPAEYLKGAAT